MTDTVRGMGRTVDVTLTRDSSTTTYAAGDVLNDSASAGTVTVLKGLFKETGQRLLSSIIQQVIVICSVAQSLKPDLELWIFDTTPAAQNDNAAFNPSDAEVARLVAKIPIPAGSFVVGGANCVNDQQNLGIPVNGISSTSVDLYMVVVVHNAYIPAGSESFTIRFKVLD